MGTAFSLILDQFQKLGRAFVTLLPALFVATIVFFAFYYGAKGLRVLAERTASLRRRRGTVIVLGRLVQSSVVLTGLLVAFIIVFPNFTGARAVELVGIVGALLSFAFRDILENFFAGVVLLWNEPFHEGDQIVVGDIEGTVEEIQSRATAIRTYDGRRIFVPNADLFTMPVTVNTAFERRRLEYEVGISYDVDIRRAQQLILEAVRSVGGVLPEPPPDVIVVELGEYAVLLRARWWMEAPVNANVLDLRDHVLAAIKERLLAYGIDLPFPTQEVLVREGVPVSEFELQRRSE